MIWDSVLQMPGRCQVDAEGCLLLHFLKGPRQALIWVSTASCGLWLGSIPQFLQGTVSLLWLSMQNYLSLGSGHSCPCSACKRKRMDGAVWLRSQNLKTVFAASAAALSISKNTPNTTSSGRGGQFLEEASRLCLRLSMQLLGKYDCGGCLWKSTPGTILMASLTVRVCPVFRAPKHTRIQMLCLKK